jgi:hypothetical protein
MNPPRPSQKLNLKLSELATSSQSVESLAREVQKNQVKLYNLANSTLSYISQLKSEFKKKTLSSNELANKLSDTMKNITKTLKTKPAKADIDNTLEQLEKVLQGETVIDRDSKTTEDEPKIVKPKIVKPKIVKPKIVTPKIVTPKIVKPSDVPDASESDASEPGESEGDVSEPDVSEPDVSEPDVSEPDVSESDADEPSEGKNIISQTEGDKKPPSTEQEIDGVEKKPGLFARAFTAVNTTIDGLLDKPKQTGGFRYSSGYNNISTERGRTGKSALTGKSARTGKSALTGKSARTGKSALTGKSKRSTKFLKARRPSKRTVKKTPPLNKNTSRKKRPAKNRRRTTSKN